MDSRKGQLILAGADLADPNFQQTVTLIVEHSPAGALGLTLNRPSETTMKQAWSQVDHLDTPCNHTGLVYLGGPCPGPLMLLHTDAFHSQMEVTEGVYLTAEPEDVAWLLEHHQGQMRCFATHSGWGPGQLDSELEHESWIVTKSTKAEVFEGSQRQWLDLVRRKNPTQAALINNPDLLNTDPSMN